MKKANFFLKESIKSMVGMKPHLAIIRKSSKLLGEGNATTCYISRPKFIDSQKVGVV